MKKELEEELYELKSTLVNRSEEGFSVPDNYFETLHARVMSRVEETENPKGFLGKYLSWILGMSLVIVAILLLNLRESKSTEMEYVISEELMIEFLGDQELIGIEEISEIVDLAEITETSEKNFQNYETIFDDFDISDIEELIL